MRFIDISEFPKSPEFSFRCITSITCNIYYFNLLKVGGCWGVKNIQICTRTKLVFVTSKIIQHTIFPTFKHAPRKSRCYNATTRTNTAFLKETDETERDRLEGTVCPPACWRAPVPAAEGASSRPGFHRARQQPGGR